MVNVGGSIPPPDTGYISNLFVKAKMENRAMTFGKEYHTLSDSTRMGIPMGLWLASTLLDPNSDYRIQYPVAVLRENVFDVVEHAHIHDWSAVSVMLGVDRGGATVPEQLESPEQDIDNAPEGVELCTWLAGLAQARVIRDALLALVDKTGEDNEDTVSGDGWLFHGGYLFFDPDMAHVLDVVHRFENVYELAFYEDAINELEREYNEHVSWPAYWDMANSEYDETISEESVRVLFLGGETSPCARCMMEPRPDAYLPDGAGKCVECVNTTYTMNTNRVCSYCE